MNYDDYLKQKFKFIEPSGFLIDVNKLNSKLFGWQKLFVRWLLYKGKAAAFEDTGLGKTPQQLEWGRQVYKKTKGNILIFAPLAVSYQTIREGKKFNIKVNYCRSQSDIKKGLNITNYERKDKFDANEFAGLVLDESSIIKNYMASFTDTLLEKYDNIPYKLCCSATPAPNDYTELGNTAEFLNIMTRSEMLSMFFINDTKDVGKWRLKGHVKDNVFWQWLSSWAIFVRDLEDIGIHDNRFKLPKLNIYDHIVSDNKSFSGFSGNIVKKISISDIRKISKKSMNKRINKCKDLIDDNVWCVWCSTNEESKLLTNILNGTEVKGSDKAEYKENTFLDFANNEIGCLITKPKIAMFGMNWQNCYNTIITGLSYSYEAFYQLIRRFWRFGQVHEVNVHIVIGESEKYILDIVKKKESDMKIMVNQMVKYTKELVKKEIFELTNKENDFYNPCIDMQLPRFFEE